MKTLFLLFFSFSLFAQSLASHSGGYFFNDDGTYTIVKADPGSVASPTLNKASFHGVIFSDQVLVKKQSYFIAKIDGERKLFSIDNLGFVYKVEAYLKGIKGKISHYGDNFFITSKGQFHYINSKGVVGSYDPKLDKSVDFRKTLKAVGSYLFVKGKKGKIRFFTVSHEGFYYEKTELFKHKLEDVSHFGFNYLQMKDGSLYTLGNIIDSNAGNYMVLYHLTELGFEFSNIMGGTFFFDTENSLHTIAFDGSFDKHGFASYRVNTYKKENGVWSIDKEYQKDRPDFVGGNYLIYGKDLFLIDSLGFYYYIEELDSRVSLTNI